MHIIITIIITTTIVTPIIATRAHAALPGEPGSREASPDLFSIYPSPYLEQLR